MSEEKTSTLLPANKSQAFVENDRCLTLHNDVKFCINTNRSIKLY